MGNIYESDLHRFVSGYLDAVGAKIDNITEDYFESVFPSGERVVYTYSAKVAAEDENIFFSAREARH